MVRHPAIGPALLAARENVVEPVLQIPERANHVIAHHRLTRRRAEPLVQDAVPNEIDERVRFRIEVIPREQDLGVLHDLFETPAQRSHIPRQRRMRPQRIEVPAVSSIGREVVHLLQRLRRDPE